MDMQDDLDEATLEPKDEEFLDEEWRESLGDPVEEDYEGNLGRQRTTHHSYTADRAASPESHVSSTQATSRPRGTPCTV